MKEEIIFDGQICAIILAANFDEPGTHFFTPRETRFSACPFSQPAAGSARLRQHRQQRKMPGKVRGRNVK
jgi:hypothetical protein